MGRAVVINSVYASSRQRANAGAQARRARADPRARDDDPTLAATPSNHNQKNTPGAGGMHSLLEDH